MTEYTKTGLLFLMIALIVSLCSTPIAFGFYSTIDLIDLEKQLPSILMVLMPVALIGVLAGVLTLLGAIFIVLGHKEFGEKHRKYIFYCVIIFIVMLGIIMFFVFMNFAATFSSLFTRQFQQASPALTSDFFITQLTYSLIQSCIVALLSGLLWVFALYHLESKKGRMILLAAFTFMILTPIVISIGSLMLVDEWTAQGTLDDVLENQTSGTSMYSQLITFSQWSGGIGVIVLLVSMLGNLLLFVALFIAYKRIAKGELSISLSTEETYHL